MNAQQIIKEVSDTGARFVIEGDDIGLTQVVPDELLNKARLNKLAIKKILLSLQKQKINRPKVWSLKVKTGNSINTMTVIDPDQMNKEAFRKSQGLVFGSDRVVSFYEKDSYKDY